MKKLTNKQLWDRFCDKYQDSITCALTVIYDKIGKDGNKYGILMVYSNGDTLGNVFDCGSPMNIITPESQGILVGGFAIHNTSERLEKLSGAIGYLVFKQLQYREQIQQN